MEYFNEKEFELAKKQRKKTLAIFLIVLGVYVLATAGMFVWYRLLEYKSPTILTVKIIQHCLSGIFIIFSFIFMGIRYKRVNRYYRIVKYVTTGIKEYSEASFFEYSNNIQDKDGVDFKSLIFLEWNKYKKEYFERKVLVFNEKPFPEFREGDYVKFVTQSNILVSYDILERAEENEPLENQEIVEEEISKVEDESLIPEVKSEMEDNEAQKEISEKIITDETAEENGEEISNDKGE